LLLFNRKLTADEAFKYGLLTEVVSDQSFEVKSTKRLEIISKLPREVFI
jgi:enoyl-CoA hydratase/carnithine racemase